VDADEALMRAWDLAMYEGGPTDKVMDEAEQLLPTLVAAGYADTGDGTWWFTPEGVKRAEAIEAKDAEGE
jgi:hypothetical protein